MDHVKDHAYGIDVPARAGDVEIVFEALPPGPYAIVVTHDERITEYCDRTVHITDGVLAA